MGATRRAHLAGSHPSARRGAHWELGPGQGGLDALTRRAAEAPARRRVCICWVGRGRPIDTHFAGRGLRPPPAAVAGRGPDRREGGSGGWDAGAQLRCGRTAVALGNAGPGGAEEGGARPASGSARAPGLRGGGARDQPGIGGRARAGGRGAGAEAGGRGEGLAARMRAAPAPPGLAGLVRAHARCPPEASGCAERARAARRRTCEVSLEEREGGWVRGARGLGRFNPSLGVSSAAARLQSLYFFSGPRRGRGGKGSGLGVGRRMSGLKKRKTTHHLGWASSRGRPLGIGGEGQSSSARPGGLAATGQAPRRAAGSRASASRRWPAVPGAGSRERGSQMAAGRAAQTGQRQGRGRARPRGSRTPEPRSIVVAEGRGSKSALGAVKPRLGAFPGGSRERR